jgi:hypothetical protein
VPGTSRSFAPVWHSHAGRLYDSPGILDVRVIEPVIFCASVTFILYNLFLIHDCVFFKALEAWRFELAACGFGLGA